MDAYTGEIRAFPYYFQPYGWFLCDGSLYPITHYPALYALIGNTYGGSAGQTFAVPNLKGFVVVGANSPTLGKTVKTTIGSEIGETSVQLLDANLPAHNHNLTGLVPTAGVTALTAQPNADGTSVVSRGMVASGAAFAAFDKTPLQPTAKVGFGVGQVGSFGGNARGSADAHTNMMPTLTMRFYICSDNIFPNFP